MNEQQAFETVLRSVRAMAEYGPLASLLRKRGREGFEAVVLEAATALHQPACALSVLCSRGALSRQGRRRRRSVERAL
jgi:hypothetical protein